ncbi:MAG: head decoration protein [Azoarcus sp.]|jgi:hypothetical protein|nr:head decoration protein [Azoarcus sp.]
MARDSSPVLSDLLKWEVDRNWSRDAVTLTAAAPATWPMGTVLAQAANGKYSPVNPSGSGAAAASVAVLLETVIVPAGDTASVALRRGAIVDPALLVWPATTTETQIATGLAGLESRGIVARNTY